ncbi:hypothetical protein ZTR_02276 [Talaromyces verruculosus]|nr:hypothetical protein ZTR_02276 [Talaromyces verruculosus]
MATWLKRVADDGWKVPLFKHLSKFSINHTIYTRRTFSARPRLLNSAFPNPAPEPSSAALRARLQKFNDRLPSFLRGYTTPLIGAPTTHITSFLILHEITAVVPLFGLFGFFHYSGWTPLLSAGDDSSLNDAVQRFGKWMTKKGWVGSEDVEAAKNVSSTATTTGEDGDKSQVLMQQKGAQLVLQFAAAYVTTKALLPLRIVASVWATPWFARVLLVPIGRGVKRIFRRT